MKKNPHLYWVTDADGAEDWFVAAPTPRSASRFYEDYIGMDKNDATAELVLSNIELPEYECGSPPCWLSLNDLQALGFTVLNPEPGLLTVTLGNRTFSEGYFEMLRSGRHMRVHCWFGKGQARAIDLFNNRLATRNRLPDHLPGRECPAKNPSAGVQGRPSRNGNWSNAQ